MSTDVIFTTYCESDFIGESDFVQVLIFGLNIVQLI